MIQNEATTIWERFELKKNPGMNSHNHPMFGACVKQIFYGLLGIQADIGFRNIKIEPKYLDGLGFVRAKIKFPHGTLCLEYRYQDGTVQTEIKTSGAIKVL